ncbi:MAG: hypothetical protein ACEQSU_05060 [Microgenomates group bacterium]
MISNFSNVIRTVTAIGFMTVFGFFEAATSFAAQARFDTAGICAMQIGAQSYDLPTCPQLGKGR